MAAEPEFAPANNHDRPKTLAAALEEDPALRVRVSLLGTRALANFEEVDLERHLVLAWSPLTITDMRSVAAVWAEWLPKGESPAAKDVTRLATDHEELAELVKRDENHVIRKGIARLGEAASLSADPLLMVTTGSASLFLDSIGDRPAKRAAKKLRKTVKRLMADNDTSRTI